MTTLISVEPSTVLSYQINSKQRIMSKSCFVTLYENFNKFGIFFTKCKSWNIHFELSIFAVTGDTIFCGLAKSMNEKFVVFLNLKPQLSTVLMWLDMKLFSLEVSRTKNLAWFMLLHFRNQSHLVMKIFRHCIC